MSLTQTRFTLHFGHNISAKTGEVTRMYDYERRRNVRGWADFANHQFDIIRFGRRFVALERAR